jgi:hypothetical protein
VQVSWVRFKLGFNQQNGVVLTWLALAQPREELPRSFLVGYENRVRPGT